MDKLSFYERAMIAYRTEILLLIVLFGVIAGVCFFLAAWYRQKSEYHATIEEETRGREWQEFRHLMGRGAVFCTLFTVKDIDICAHEIGIPFITNLEQAQIVNLIRKNFDPETGISYPVIKTAIREHFNLKALLPENFENFEN